MLVVQSNITLSDLRIMAKNMFGNLVKAVVDIDRGVIAVDAELHSDLEALLLEQGSVQQNLWGINLYPDLADDEFVEFDSMINVRPSQGNRSRSVDNEQIRDKITKIVWQKVLK